MVKLKTKCPFINQLFFSFSAHVGHTESVSGATGLLRVILSMEHGLIPPQPFSAPLNPKLNLENITIPQKALPWKGKYAGVSSFGITGTNAHLIVERGQKSQTQPPNNSSLIPSYILPLSAKCPGALKELKLKHAVALEQLDG
jgi:acyl transferase domain-containing protein